MYLLDTGIVLDLREARRPGGGPASPLSAIQVPAQQIFPLTLQPFSNSKHPAPLTVSQRPPARLFLLVPAHQPMSVCVPAAQRGWMSAVSVAVCLALCHARSLLLSCSRFTCMALPWASSAAFPADTAECCSAPAFNRTPRAPPTSRT